VRPGGERGEIRTVDDWQVRRRQILVGIEQAMGDMPRPEDPVALDVQIIEEHQDDGVIRRKLSYHTDTPDGRVTAWLLIPADRPQKCRPAVLCLHQTTPGGKNSPAGISDRWTMHYALQLAQRGFVTLSPDYPSMGDYQYDFDADNYESGSMKAIYDNVRAIDLLQSLPEVDPDRIGCIGHSLGGHNGLFTAVFDQRIKAVVTSCGFTSFHKYKGGDLRGWSGPRYMPRIASRYHFSPDEMPFDFHEVLAAIAPRGVFIVAPLDDDNFDVLGVRDCVYAAVPIYQLLGTPERIQVVYPSGGHDFPDAEREKSFEFLESVLRSSK
jgi:acetyl esterase/lipase